MKQGERPIMRGAERIVRERQRQIEKKGWTAEHDDEHIEGELGLVAALYASPVKLYRREHSLDKITWLDAWPDTWDARWDKRPYVAYSGILRSNKSLPVGRRIRQLEKAGALVAAEIDRLLRQELPA